MRENFTSIHQRMIILSSSFQNMILKTAMPITSEASNDYSIVKPLLARMIQNKIKSQLTVTRFSFSHFLCYQSRHFQINSIEIKRYIYLCRKWDKVHVSSMKYSDTKKSRKNFLYKIFRQTLFLYRSQSCVEFNGLVRVQK